MTYDLIIRNGTVVDGSGSPGYRGDVAVSQGRIAAIGTVRESASEAIEADGQVVAPGFVDTDMMAKYADYREKMESQIPAGRFARPDEIGSLVAFLMSPAAGYITGTTIAIDGGLMASMGLQR